jgi:hypothetical protein
MRAEPDPIFALIEEHSRAYAAVNVEVVKTNQWEAVIPEEKRKTLHVDEEVFETGDPRWLAHKRTLRALFDAECALADIVPTTTAGVCAILKDGVKRRSGDPVGILSSIPTMRASFTAASAATGTISSTATS